jgi:hypothetical protein
MIVGLILLLASPGASMAVEVTLHSSAIGKLVEERVFNQDGRKYLFGNPDTRCMRAYLYDPRVSIDAGRLILRSKFNGILGQELNEDCLGLSESFPVTMTGVPYFRGGTMGLEQIQISGLSDIPQFNDYITRFFEEELHRIFSHDLNEEIRNLIAQNRGAIPYDVEVLDLDISRIVAADEILSLWVNFHLVLK